MGMLLAIEGDGALPTNLQPDGTLVVGERLSLGSAPENDLVLDTAKPVHCLIFNDRGSYQILDHSNGGIVMNDAPAPLAGEGPVALSIGDSLVIGGYRLTVLGDSRPAAGDTPDEAQAGEDTPAEPDLLDRVVMAEEDADYAVRRGDGSPPWDDEDGDLFPAAAGASQFDHLDPIHEAYAAPMPGRNVIPDDWDLLAEIPGSREPGCAGPVPEPGQQSTPAAPKPAASLRPPVRDNALTLAFCRGAGLDPVDIPAGQDMQTLELAGQLLATALAGIQMLLSDCTTDPGRSAIGQGGVTNPLGLPGTSRDILRLLMRGPLPNLLPGDLAISGACSDIAAQREDLRNRLREVSGMATGLLSPDAIAAAIEPMSLSQRLRHLRGGPDPFRRAFERRHREVALSISVLSGQVAENEPHQAAGSGHG